MTALLVLATLLFQDVPKLIDELGSEDLEVREAAAGTLASLGEKAEEELKKRLPDLSGEVKARAEAVLARIASDRVRAKVLPPVRRATIDVKDKPVKEALAMLSEQTGLAVAKVEDRATVTVSLKDALPLEALDAICKAAGSSYSIDSRDDAAPAVRLWRGGGFADVPRVYVRHYRAAVTHIQFIKANDFKTMTSNASVQMQILWPPDLKPESVARFEVTEMTDDKGRSLLPDKPQPGGRNRIRYGRGWNQVGHTHHQQTKFPESDASKIAAVKAKVALRFPAKGASVSFAAASETGATKDLAGAKITLKEAGAQGANYRVVVEVTGRVERVKDPEDAGDAWQDHHGISSEDVKVKGEDGQELRPHGMSGTGSRDKTTWTLTYDAPKGAATIEIAATLEYVYDGFEFELKDIALPK